MIILDIAKTSSSYCFLITVKYSVVNSDLVHVLGVFSSLTVLRVIASSTL